MVRSVVMLGGCLCSALLSGCSDGGGDGFTDTEWDVIHSLSPLPDVDYDANAAPLGQQLFFDARLSGPIVVADDGSNNGNGAEGEIGKVRCATCHIPDAWFIDTRSRPNATSLGTGWTTRNAPTVVNAVYHESFPWHGKFPTIAELMRGPLLGAPLMNSTPQRIAQVLTDHYQLEYDSLFPDTPLPNPIPDCMADKELDAAACPEATTLMANVGYALEAYQRRLISRNAPFDRYVAGDADAISDSAKRGLALFIGDGLCIECHNGPSLSDDGFYRTDIGQTGDKVPAVDEGRGDREFRTPSLRSVGETAPYMHAGQLATLTDVVDFYWLGAGDGATHPALTPLEISEGDRADIVAFLMTLTGDPIPSALREDTSKP